MAPLTRREWLLGTFAAASAAGQTRSRWIDVHHHIIPPQYLNTVGSAAIGGPAGRATAPGWSPAVSLDAMDALGIESAVVSISAPGFPLADVRGRARLTRDANVYARQLREDHPGRFGTFAAVPLPDVPTAIQEAVYALDTLHADGIGLLTSYEGSYLGDEHFAPFFDELQRRKAVVFVHPTPCTCSAGVMTGLAPSAIEYPQETTRTIATLLFSGTLDRCPDVKFIFCHGGGTLPYVAGRIANRKTDKAPNPQASLSRLYFDVAQAMNAITLPALLRYATPQRVVFGTDFPFIGVDALRPSLATLAPLVPDEKDLRTIARDNVLSLIPRLRA